MATLQFQLWLPATLEEVWAFHTDPQNLLKVSPPFLALALDQVPETIAKGSEFLLHSQNRFLKNFLNWKVNYEDWNDEADYKMFIDSQQEGPFRLWKHEHEFVRGTRELHVEEKSFKPKYPGTWIKDTIEYQLKSQLKAFDFIAEKLLIRLFVYRKRALLKIFETIPDQEY